MRKLHQKKLNGSDGLRKEIERQENLIRIAQRQFVNAKDRLEAEWAGGNLRNAMNKLATFC